MKSLIYPILLLTLINCEISNILWRQEAISNVSQVNYLSLDEFLVYSERGIISRMNSNGDAVWKKNLIYPKKCEIISEDQCNGY
jgi:hypothetical protein